MLDCVRSPPATRDSFVPARLRQETVKSKQPQSHHKLGIKPSGRLLCWSSRGSNAALNKSLSFAASDNYILYNTIRISLNSL